jgi:enediyne biosynthesis protein E4
LIPGGKTIFKEVTSTAGIYNSQIGYGLGVAISDLNKDGFADIYVSNDFHENDYLYINERNGQFREVLTKSMGHTSRFSMGNDVADINNDGLQDLITLDMLPKEESVIKTTAGDDPYDIYEFKLRYGYHHQLSRNTLQLNVGKDAEGNPLFTDIAPFAGVEATDWSWSALLADFDNDGFRDLFVANGILRRPNDLDYITYISSDSAQRFFKDNDFVKAMPSGEVANVIFKNNRDLTFSDETEKWLGSETSLSTGAAYADFDNDGDLDLVLNNINAEATLFRNTLPQSQFVDVTFEGDSANTFGLGAKATIYYNGLMLYGENCPTRGWQSSVAPSLHFGLGDAKSIDSLVIEWPGGRRETFKNVKTNQTLIVKYENSRPAVRLEPKSKPMLISAGEALFSHKENTYVSFNKEKLIPYMLTTEGPTISKADINGDGHEDFYIGGASGQPGQIFLQWPAGKFIRKSQPVFIADSAYEDVGSAFFDADDNGTLDLVVVAGGQEFEEGDLRLTPRLYLNDGKANFVKSLKAFENVFLNGSCVVPYDVDNDRDLDLFIGARVITGKYGLDPKSYIFTNNGKGVFLDKTEELLPESKGKLGMVSDAAATDINKDGRVDLIITGEWMPVTVLIQDSASVYKNQTQQFGLLKTSGWWNCVLLEDFDGDGDQDFVAGNYGTNSRLRATATEPVELYVGDIDGNGSLDHILTRYNDGKKYPFITRDQLVKQVPALKKKFLKYKSFASVTIEDILSKDQLAKFVKKEAQLFESSYFENRGNKFVVKKLPSVAQLSPMYSFCRVDVDVDGKMDVIGGGNLYSMQPDIGRADASYGLVMRNAGDRFEPLSSIQSGLQIKGEVRAIVEIKSKNNGKIILIGRNNSELLMFNSNQ